MIDDFVPCDECGHRSFVFAILDNGGELSWCGHHGKPKIDALRRQGAIVDDLTKYI